MKNSLAPLLKKAKHTGIEEGLLLVFVTWLAFSGAAVKIAGQILVLIGNYAISKWLIFRKK